MYKISIQYTNPFKRYRTETIFQSWKFFKVEKGHNSQNNWWILPWIELGLHFMIIYLCIKFQSNTPILSKGIARKPKVLHTGWTGRDRTDGRDGGTYIRTAVILYGPPPIENGGGHKNVLTILPKPHAHPHTMKKTHAKFQNNQYKTVRGVALTRGSHCLYIEVKND